MGVPELIMYSGDGVEQPGKRYTDISAASRALAEERKTDPKAYLARKNS